MAIALPPMEEHRRGRKQTELLSSERLHLKSFDPDFPKSLTQLISQNTSLPPRTFSQHGFDSQLELPCDSQLSQYNSPAEKSRSEGRQAGGKSLGSGRPFRTLLLSLSLSLVRITLCALFCSLYHFSFFLSFFLALAEIVFCNDAMAYPLRDEWERRH